MTAKATGYDLTRINEIADENTNETTVFLQNEARKHGHKVHEYSKLHLFKLMDEHLYLLLAEIQSGYFSLKTNILQE